MKIKSATRAAAALLTVLLLGCSALPPSTSGPVQPARRPVSRYVDPNITYPLDVFDPFESFNRGVYTFNAGFDEYVFLPVVRTYQRFTPNVVEDRISSFFSNISDIRNLLNAALQLKGEQAVRTFARLVYNTTFGILGLWDPASAMGLPQRREDFGQTLGFYGLGEGPYLVLPLIGPSNLRDAAGLAVDTIAFNSLDPLRLDDHAGRKLSYITLNAIDARSNTDFRYYESGSPFDYSQVRFFYTQMRRFQIQLRRPTDDE